MAIGERIRFIRNLRGMTQKYLGTLVGFPEKTADIRMAQYESGTRTPKAELTKSRQDATVNREDGRQAGQKEQQALIEEAQKDAQKILGEARAKLTAEAEASLVELRYKVGNLSQQLVARVLNG